MASSVFSARLGDWDERGVVRSRRQPGNHSLNARRCLIGVVHWLPFETYGFQSDFLPLNSPVFYLGPSLFHMKCGKPVDNSRYSPDDVAQCLSSSRFAPFLSSAKKPVFSMLGEMGTASSHRHTFGETLNKIRAFGAPIFVAHFCGCKQGFSGRHFSSKAFNQETAPVDPQMLFDPSFGRSGYSAARTHEQKCLKGVRQVGERGFKCI